MGIWRTPSGLCLMKGCATRVCPAPSPLTDWLCQRIQQQTTVGYTWHSLSYTGRQASKRCIHVQIYLDTSLGDRPVGWLHRTGCIHSVSSHCMFTLLGMGTPTAWAYSHSCGGVQTCLATGAHAGACQSLARGHHHPKVGMIDSNQTHRRGHHMPPTGATSRPLYE